MVETQPEKQIRAATPGSFKPGVSGNPSGRPKDSGVEDRYLQDMRAVYRHPTRAYKSSSRKRLQDWFEKDPKGFVAELSRQAAAHKRVVKESAAASATKEVVSEKEVVADYASDRLRELIPAVLNEAVGRAIHPGA